MNVTSVLCPKPINPFQIKESAKTGKPCEFMNLHPVSETEHRKLIFEPSALFDIK